MSPRMVVRAITLSTALLLLAFPEYSQQTGGGTPARPPGSTTGTSNTTGTSTGTVPTNLPSNSSTTTGTKPPPGYAPPIFLNGRVALEDGSPPPEPATIERFCNGQSHAEGYTDSRGNFAIQLGNESTVFQDASEDPLRNANPGMSGAAGSTGSNGSSQSGGFNSFSKYQSCELRAKLAGYRSQTISLANRRALDDPNIGTILLHKDGGEGGTTVSASTLAAPKDARKAYEKGLQEEKKNKPEEAARDFQKAVDLYPNLAEAWCELGKIQAGHGDNATARQSFDAAVKADPKFVSPYVHLAILMMAEKQWQELADTTDRGMHLDSFDYPQLFLFNAVANYNMHKFELAERSLKQAIRLDTQHRYPDIPRLNGLLMVLHKDYEGAAEQFHLYLKIAPEGEEANLVRAQLSQIERINARSSTAPPKEK